MNTLALVIGVLALAVSGLSWIAAVHANRAAIYDRRFEVYLDAEKFLGAWTVHGRPDMDLLPTLVAAWGRSHFLFEQAVTDYLRKVWLDALKVQQCGRIIAGEQQGDRNEAITKEYELSIEHLNADKLRAAFKRQLKVSDGLIQLPSWLTG